MPSPSRSSRRPEPVRPGGAAGLLLLLLATGCLPGYLRLTVNANSETNQGRPLRVLVRKVSEAQYRSESYASVAALVITPDASVVRSFIVDPRSRYKRSFWVKSESSTPLGLYFLYTGPTASWKMWLQPQLPWRITVPLGRSGVDGERVRECRILRW